MVRAPSYESWSFRHLRADAVALCAAMSACEKAEWLLQIFEDFLLICGTY